MTRIKHGTVTNNFMRKHWWWVISCGVLALMICTVGVIGAGYIAFKRGRGTPQLSSTVAAIQQSPIVPATIVAPSVTPSGTLPASTSSSVSNVSPASCSIVNMYKIGDGGDQDWSHSTGKLVFDRKDADGVYQLYVGDPDTGDFACISCSAHPGAPATNRQKSKAMWSPDGKFIVLEAEMDNHPLSKLPATGQFSELINNGVWNNIYATTPDGSQWFKLTDKSTTGTNSALFPAFSPDGTKMMWSQMVKTPTISSPLGVWHLMIADFVVENAAPRLANIRDITPPGARFVESHVFSPDGRSVMFAADINSSSPLSTDIWTLNLTTGEALNLTHDKAWDEHAVYTLDGQHIVYMTSLPYPGVTYKTDLMVMNLDGTDKRPFSHFNVEGYPEYVPGKEHADQAELELGGNAGSGHPTVGFFISGSQSVDGVLFRGLWRMMVRRRRVPQSDATNHSYTVGKPIRTGPR